MSSDLYADKIFVLDTSTHSSNISMFEFMTILGSQAPISNLLLVPAFKLQPWPMSTLISVPSTHLKNKLPVVPTAAAAAAATAGTHLGTDICEPENDLYKEFIILYWMMLAFVIIIALLAIWTKLTMSVRKSSAERKPDSKSKPLTDVERWCMRRQKMRELEAESQEEKSVQTEAGRG